MRHIPNALSVFRIVLIPFFVVQFISGNTMNAAVILALSGLTDLLDGQLARRFGWVSQLGKLLDPAADKLTQVTVCVVLAIYLRQYWGFFVILLVKDLVMLILGGYLLKKEIKLDGARWFGKVTTALFYLSMVLVVFFPDMPSWGINLLLGLTTGSALCAGLLYLPQFFRYRREIGR